MAKCSFCNAKKGKRKCIAVNGVACSLCCGQSRSEDKCAGCSFYGPAARRYTRAPYYALSVMSDSDELNKQAYVVESNLCALDQKNNHSLTDDIAADILERLLDKYHFGDKSLTFGSPLTEEGFKMADRAIQKHCPEVAPEQMAKILGTVYRSVKRRTNGSREYYNFIQQYSKPGQYGLDDAGSGKKKLPRAVWDFLTNR